MADWTEYAEIQSRREGRSLENAAYEERIAELEATVARLTHEKADERARVISECRALHGNVSCEAAEEDRYGLGAGYADFKADAERLEKERAEQERRIRADERARVIAAVRGYTSHSARCASRYHIECRCGVSNTRNDEPSALATPAPDDAVQHSSKCNYSSAFPDSKMGCDCGADEGQAAGEGGVMAFEDWLSQKALEESNARMAHADDINRQLHQRIEALESKIEELRFREDAQRTLKLDQKKRAELAEHQLADERARVIEECAHLCDQAVGAMAKHAPAAYTVRHIAARIRSLATERDES